MIETILGLIIKLILFIIRLLFTILLSPFTAFTDLSTLTSVITAFYKLINGAINMTYFLVGDTFSFFVTTISTIYIIKYVALPTYNFVRKFFTK